MNADAQFLKAMRIAPAEIPEPKRAAPAPTPATMQMEAAVDEDGNIVMTRESFAKLLAANHSLGEGVGQLRARIARERRRWLIALGVASVLGG